MSFNGWVQIFSCLLSVPFLSFSTVFFLLASQLRKERKQLNKKHFICLQGFFACIKKVLANHSEWRFMFIEPLVYGLPHLIHCIPFNRSQWRIKIIIDNSEIHFKIPLKFLQRLQIREFITINFRYKEELFEYSFQVNTSCQSILVHQLRYFV